MGVPHTEVDLILVNGESVDFAYRVRDGDRISVYPVFEALDIAAVTRLRPEPLREVRSVLDVHLGRLAKLFSRCMRCNTPLAQAGKDQIALLYDEFPRCPACGRAYWKGGRFRSMRARG
jgi:hypothetical protein